MSDPPGYDGWTINEKEYLKGLTGLPKRTPKCPYCGASPPTALCGVEARLQAKADAPERTPLYRYDIDDSDLRDVHMRAFEKGGYVKYSDFAALEQERDRYKRAWGAIHPLYREALSLTKPEGE